MNKLEMRGRRGASEKQVRRVRLPQNGTLRKASVKIDCGV